MYGRWYSVEKYEENEAGDLVQTYSFWVINGEIVYFDDENSDVDTGMRMHLDLNVPVPFKPGDLIGCDGGPTCDETMAVVLRVGDNFDCCSLVALCKRKGDVLEYTLVKHSSMFYEADMRLYVPPLYSARCVNLEIGEVDEALQ